MYCDLWTIITWGHPSPLRHADVLWVVRELVLTLVTLFPCRNQKLLCCTAKYHQDYRFAMFINQGWEKRTLLHLPLLKIVFCCIVVWIQPYNSGFSKFPKLVDPLAVLQGVWGQSCFFNWALTERNIQLRLYLKVVLNSWDMAILIFWTNFQKNIIGWPQQPPTEKVQKLINDISWFHKK